MLERQRLDYSNVSNALRSSGEMTWDLVSLKTFFAHSCFCYWAAVVHCIVPKSPLTGRSVQAGKQSSRQARRRPGMPACAHARTHVNATI